MEDAAHYERDKVVVRLLADTGIRLGELRALRRDDVRTDGGRDVLRIRARETRDAWSPSRPAWPAA
ncbi:MAG: hypothetical protein ACREQM_19620 [Candidatus Dormibacteraceae bacterium]